MAWLSLTGFGLAAGIFPLVAFLKTSLSGWASGGLSLAFGWIALRSVGFTLLQACLSASLTLVFALVIGTALALAEGRFARSLRRFAELAGSLCFALPGVLVALVSLGVSERWAAWPSIGLAGIVAAHVLVHALFVASGVARSLRNQVLGGGAELLAAATTLGASPRRALATVFARPLAHEARTWWPLVFLWSFGAFSTVVILGGGPRASSPEVLLYFALQTDPDPARIFVLSVLQFGVAATLAWLAARRSGASEATSTENFDRTESSQPCGTRIAGAWSALGVGALLAAFAPLWASPFRLLSKGGLPPDGFGVALGASLSLATLTALGVMVFFELLLRAGSRVRRFVFSLSGISPTLLAALWISAGADLWAESAWSQFFLSGLGLACVFAPFAAYWIERELDRFPATTLEAAALLGANDSEILGRIVRPSLRDLRLRLLSLASLGAIGDLSFSTLFLRDTETLATMSRRMASRYDFSGSSWVLATLFGVCAFVWIASRRHGEKS